MPVKKETAENKVLEFWPLSSLHEYKSVCSLRETRTGYWRILKSDTIGIKFPTNITDLSKVGKHWAVEFKSCERQFSGFTIPSKIVRIPLLKALQLGEKDTFNNKGQLLNELKITARALNYSDVAETIREPMQLTA